MAEGMCPGNASYPANPDTGSGGDSTWQDIAKFMSMVSPQYQQKTPEQLADEKRKRLFGMLTSAVAGAMMTRKSPAGGMAGAVSGAGGFASSDANRQAGEAAAQQQRAEFDSKARTNAAELGVKLQDIRAKRGMNSTDPFQHVPEKVKAYLFRNSLPESKRSEFDQFYNPDKPDTAGSVEKDIKFYNSLPDGPTKDWAKKVIQFRTSGGTGLGLEFMQPGSVDAMFGGGKGTVPQFK